MATQKEKAEVAKKVQNDWQKFGKKAQKKGIHIAGLEGKSVFRTSDSVHGVYIGVLNALVLTARSGRCLQLGQGRDRVRTTWEAQV